MEVTESLKDELMRRPKRQRPAVVADEPTKTEIMEDIRIGLQQAAAGEGRPCA